MLPWVQLDSATDAGRRQELRLKRRGSEFSIMLGTNELMNSRLSGSEEALATLSCQRIGGRTAPQILIGGLGMGFTCAPPSPSSAPTPSVVVAELVPAVVAWARGPMAEVFGDCLDDPRVTHPRDRCRPADTRRCGHLRRHPARRRQWSRRTVPQGQ